MNAQQIAARAARGHRPGAAMPRPSPSDQRPPVKDNQRSSHSAASYRRAMDGDM
uniref:Uncharacterized protein n=1 Tax=Arundo donax TaxID=35708 RepID=A0A0A8Z088_ARUDO